MQKRVLACLLASPLALNALAEVVVNDNLANGGTGWTQSGVTGEDPIFNQNGVNCPFTTGVITTQLADLNPGKYLITFGESTNIKVEVKEGDQVISTVKDGVVSFDLSEKTGTTTVTVVISSGDQINGFSFTNAKLVIDIEFSELQKALNDALGDLKLESVTEGDLREDVVKELNAAKADLEKQIAAIQKDIDALDNETLEVYNEYKLWEDPNMIAKAISALDPKVKDYNAKVEAENTTWGIVKANKAAYDGLQASISTLEAAYKVQKEAYDVAVNTEVGELWQEAYNKNYVSSKTALDAADAALKAFKAAVAKAYDDPENYLTNPKWEKEIKFEDQSESVEEKIGEAKTAIETAAKDWQAYKSLIELQAKLLSTANEVKAALAKIPALQTKVDDIYNKAMTDVKVKNGNPVGAAGLKEADETVLNKAIADIQALKEQGDNLDAAYDAAMKQVGELQDKLDAIKAPTLPAEDLKKFQELVKTAQDAINTLKEAVIAGYAAAEIPNTADLVAAAEEAIQEVADFNKDWAPIANLWISFEDLKAAIEKMQKDSGIGTDEFNLSSKFAGTLTAISNAINALGEALGDDDPNTPTQTEIENVQKGIDKAKTNAEALMEAYKGVSDAVKNFKLGIEKLDKAIADKTIVTGSTWTADAFKTNPMYVALVQQLDAFDAMRAAAAAADAQVAFNKATELMAAITEYNYEVNINDVTELFEVASTQNGNYVAVEKAIKSVKELWEHADKEGNPQDYEGKADVDFTEIDAALAAALADINKEIADYADGEGTVNVEDWSKIDTALKTLLTNVDKKKTEVQGLLDNQAAYDELMALFTPDLGDALDALIKYNNDNSITPAKEYYDNLIQGDGEKSLKSQMDALEAEIEKALKDQKAVESKDALSGKISNLKKAIDQMQNDIKANNASYGAQMNKSGEVRKHIEELLGMMSDNELTKEWRQALNDLLDKGLEDFDDNLAAVDLDVNKFYGIGQCATENDKIMSRYKAISDKADEIYSNYGDQVKATNDKTMNELAGWTATQTDMNSAYTAAIEAYNSFFGLTNDKYRTYILETVKTHQPIYEYSAEITQLIADAQDWVDKKTKDKVVFTPAEFKDEWTTKATALIAEINAKKAAMMTDANHDAQVYYNGGVRVPLEPGEAGVAYASEHVAASDAIVAAQDALEAAGVSEDNVKEALEIAYNDLAAAEKIFDGTPADGDKPAVPGFPAESEWATSTFCLIQMNSIANALDDIYKHLDLQAAAQKQWKENYAAASETLAALTEQLKKIVDTTDESLTELAGYVKDAADLNVKATGDAELIKNLKQDTEDLNDIVAAAQALVDEKQQAFDKDQANKDAYKTYDAALTQVNLDLDTLKKFAGSVAGGANYPFEPIETLIASYEKLFKETYKASLVANKATIDAALEEAQNTITAAYGDIQIMEQYALNTLLQKTQVAFNNAKVLSDMPADKLATANRNIDAFGDKIAEIAGLVVPEKKDDYSKAAVEIENGLAAIYVELMNSYEPKDGVDGGNPVPGILGALNDQYNAVAAAIAAAQEYLDGCEESVQNDPEFAGKFAEFQKELDAIKAAYDADGNRVVVTENGFEAKGALLVVTQDGYAAGMTAISGDVAALLAQVKAAQEVAADEQARIDANNAAYDRLSAQLKGYEDKLKELAEEDDELHHNVYDRVEWMFDNCWDLINRDWTLLNAAKEAVSLDDKSVLKNQGGIEYYLTQIIYESEYYYVVNLVNEMWSARRDALAALDGNLIPDKKADLQDDLNVLVSQGNEAISSTNEVLRNYQAGEINIDDYKKAMHDCDDEFLRIKGKIEELIENIEKNTFKLGDIDLDPNGEVNVVDLQILINMVGEGVEFSTLEEENPRVAYAADITKSKVIDIADVTALINMINDAQKVDETATPRLAPRAAMMTGNGVYGMDMVSSENTTREYAMALSGMTSFVGAQMDINLPVGMTLESAELVDASTDHEVAIYDNGAGSYRLVIYSMTNSTVNAVEGVMLRIHTSGIGTPEMSNVIFADEESNAWLINKANQSIIDSIISGAKNLKDRIYNAAGQTMRKIQKGINIIRHSDGTTTKEMH